jgi:prephenate dehydrogenase
VQTFGLVGYGHFAEIVSRSLTAHGRVLVYDTDPARLPQAGPNLEPASFEDVARADVVIAAVPFSALESVLSKLRPLLRPETLVMDVTSTKEHATEIFERVLHDHPNVMATHPLFGPPSTNRFVPGEKLVVTLSRGPQAQAFRQFLTDTFGLEIVDVEAHEHDEAMAYMQALPFFIARALVEIGVLNEKHVHDLVIPSFEKLARIAEIEKHHTADMFDTSQRSNPYAEAARKRFLEELTALDERIREMGPVTDE